MERGDVHRIPLDLPDRVTGIVQTRNKFVVVLRGGPVVANETDVPFVVASTDRRAPGEALRAFEVSVGPADGFNHATVIDCRWVYTMMKTAFPATSLRFRLSGNVRQQLSLALVSGLQMSIT